MNRTTMKNVTRKLVVPFLVGGMMWSGAAAKADDIINISSPQKDHAAYKTAGDKIDVVFRLLGQFALTNSTGLVQLTYPTLTMVVNGELVDATFAGLSASSASGTWKTDVRFQYTVMPGDMAAPLKIWCYDDGLGGEPYHIWLDNWRFVNVATGSNAVWKVNTLDAESYLMGLSAGKDFSAQNITISTLTFDNSNLSSVAASENTTWYIDTVDAVTNPVTIHIFTPSNGVVELNQKGTGKTDDTLTMAKGSKQVGFTIYGLKAGSSADIYAMRDQDYANYINGTMTTLTNFIMRPISVALPPAPTVRVLVSPDGTTWSDYVTLSETKDYNTGYLKVVLSEAYTNIVDVKVNIPSGQSNLTFNTTPCVVPVAKNATESAVVGFNVPDGTAVSAGSGVMLTPEVTNNVLAASYYTLFKTAKAYVKNVAPTIGTNDNVGVVAERGIPVELKWSADDVDSDKNAGMTVTWSFGDGSSTNLTGAGAVGSIFHTYKKNGTWAAKVNVKDKDGGTSGDAISSITVTDPTPQPSVRLVPAAFEYGETDATGTGALNIFLSETYTASPVYVKLTATLLDGPQSNLVLSTQVVSIPSTTNRTTNPIKFSLPDGVPDSESSGIVITPSVTNEPAKSYFTDLQPTAIWVTNNPPVIATPVARSVSLTPLPAYTNVPLGKAFAFRYQVNDVARDANTMTMYWWFEDGASRVVATNTGLSGSISYTYGSLGIKTVHVQAEDKDGGKSEIIEFPIEVVPPPPDPTVYVLPDRNSVVNQVETDPESYVTVLLSEAFTNVVTVNLTVSPVTNSVNGVVEFDSTQTVFTVGQRSQRVYYRVKDGTVKSRDDMFKVIPTVVSNDAAVAYFKVMSPGYLRIYNVAPQIVTPEATDLATEAYAGTASQGTPYVFSWLVSDVANDLRKVSVDGMAPLTITWDFGDGNTALSYGSAGTITNTYLVTGSRTVTVTATDKDGGATRVKFKIQVLPTKEVLATPVGPGGSYYAAGGLGYGTLNAPKARTPVTLVGYTYDFKFEWGDTTATIWANPYKFNGLDSFFFTWVSDAIKDTTAIDPYQSFQLGTNSVAAFLTLPTADTNNVTPATVSVRAIFSQEYDAGDNLGDINHDGIPDVIAFQMERSGLVDTGSTLPGFYNFHNYNGDGDYLPVNPTGSGGRFDFRPVSDSAGANAFTAFIEVRGLTNPKLFYKINGTNYCDQVRQDDEPLTDPTLADTDGDGFPDGWEYYFWYNAKTNNLVGYAYNPHDVSVGYRLDSKTIMSSFEPFAIRSGIYASVVDRDNDGLLDTEELALGTNPIHWDTDGDGICDAWEVLRGMDPCDPNDGVLSTENNPDGDFMAYALVPRHYALIESPLNVTNAYLVAMNLGITANETLQHAVLVGSANANGSVTYMYHYGDSNATLAVGMKVDLPSDALVVSVVETNALVLHHQVMREFGFDPRTAWTGSLNTETYPDRWPAWIDSAAHTKAFTSLDEYLVMKYMEENQLNRAVTAIGSSTKTTFWKSFTTDPKTPDTDCTTNKKDGMPDGWELYVSISPDADLSTESGRVMTISPWNAYDGDYDSEPATVINGIVPIAAKDGLINRREFGGTDSSAAYADASLYGTSNFVGVVSISRPSADTAWLNKWWPSNPWSHDTDGDGLNDLAERTFIYGTTTDNGTSCVQGGGLNPNSMDTDLDALPDAWEFEFRGTLPTSGTFGGTVAAAIVITNGMDGTVGLDYDRDWDRDGLKNYQEYWTQAVRGFRYDITDVGTVNLFGKAGQPIDATFAPSSLFTQVVNAWDRARYPWGDANAYLYVQLPLVNLYDPVNKPNLYASTDPRNYDSDGDGMDDYYEMFHGLNPLLGDPVNDDNTFVESADLVARACLVNGAATIDYNINEWGSILPPDFVRFPWMAGLPEVDADADGLRNSEEQLQPNTPAPAYSHTDPTPMWMTDESNTNSLTARFYEPMGYVTHAAGAPYSFDDSMFYWPPYPVVPPDSVFTYERNEGYDTDNDGISDKAELVGTKNVLSDPLDTDDPIRRQAFWFSGTNSAASATKAFTLGVWALRSFTVELWARPEIRGREQVLVERSFAYSPSDNSTTGKVVRHNFRIGIKDDGRVYAMFENDGVHDSHTAYVCTYGNVLATNQWTHLAARMDGSAGAFALFVNGRVYSVVETTLIPANGVLIVESDPNNPLGVVRSTIIAGGVTVGAANGSTVDLPKQTWDNYSDFYQGFIDELRIWDGACSNDEILSNYKRRLSKSEMIVNRQRVRAQEDGGYSRIWGSTLQLDPELLYYYSFDNMFGADSTNIVSTSPRGFEDLAVRVNQPADATVRWWADTEVKSTVYSDYKYLPRIENSVAHLPIFGGVTNAVTLPTNTVADSVFWTHTSAGALSGAFDFPNSGNPYNIASDLLPLGDAYAKSVSSMWDEQGSSGVWTETGIDSDSDGLPDWWERYVTGGASSTSVGWDTVNTATGKTLGEQYQRDIANGMTASNYSTWTTTDLNNDGLVDACTPTVHVIKQTADSDGDGMPDWWETIYNLDPNSATGDDGALGDPDMDGLSNLAEYQISEVYKFFYLNPRLFMTKADQSVSDYYLKQGSLTLGAMFTDHDFIEDQWENQYDTSYISPNAYDPKGDADGDGWSNWAESRFRTYQDGTRPDLAMKTEVLGLMDYEFPIPTIATKLSYRGAQTGGSLVVQIYSDPGMNGAPDATYSVPNDSTTVSTKTQQIGYWSNKVVSGTLSPGAIQPGTLGLRFTDLWTGLALTTGFDSDGVIYSGSITGTSSPIGLIDYTTGEFEIDLSHYENLWIIPNGNPAAATNRFLCVDCMVSFVQMSYSARAIATWPKPLYLGQADSGYVKEGTNYVFAFIDLDSNGSWSPNEPCGVGRPFGVDVNWSRNKVNVELSDYNLGSLRVDLSTGIRSEDYYLNGYTSGGSSSGAGNTTTSVADRRVRVRRTYVDGSTIYQKIVFDKVIHSPRSFIHEGDWLAQGEDGLDWGLTDVPLGAARNNVVYDVFVGSATTLSNNVRICTITNLFETTRLVPQAVSPIKGAYVYAARPTFKWSIAGSSTNAGYTAFAIEIRKGSDVGPVVYSSGTLLNPPRDVGTGYYSWTAPITAGDLGQNGQRFSSNSLYYWHVVALNSKFTISTPSWSSWNVFRLDVNAAPSSSGYGELRAGVKYYGPATNLSDRVKVQVYDTAGFSGDPAAQYTLTAKEIAVLTNATASVSTNAVLRGLLPSTSAGKYYVMAYIDQNTNGVRDAWESWGYYNYFGVTVTPYTPHAIAVTKASGNDFASLVIEDADTDQDWFPDSWEYERNPTDPDFLTKIGPSDAWKNGDAEVTTGTNLWAAAGLAQNSVAVALAMGTSDMDGDGIDDMTELILGTDAKAASTAGDGYSDSAKMALGLSGADKLTFNITGLSMASEMANVTWRVGVSKSSSVNRAFLAEITGIDTSTALVPYMIEYKASLTDENWSEISHGWITLDSSKTVLDKVGADSGVDLSKGFFRVRLGQ